MVSSGLKEDLEALLSPRLSKIEDSLCVHEGLLHSLLQRVQLIAESLNEDSPAPIKKLAIPSEASPVHRQPAARPQTARSAESTVIDSPSPKPLTPRHDRSNEEDFKKRRESEQKRKEELQKKKKEQEDRKREEIQFKKEEEQKKKDELREKKKKEENEKKNKIEENKLKILNEKKLKSEEKRTKPEDAKRNKLENIQRQADVGANAKQRRLDEEHKSEPHAEEAKSPSEIALDKTLLEEINSQLKTLQESHSEEELTTQKVFELSVGSASALSIIGSMEQEKFHLTTLPPPNVVWAFRLFFQLTAETLPETDFEAWSRCQEYFRKALESQDPALSVAETSIEAAKNFNFSNENLDKVEKLLKGQEATVNPQHFTESCPMTGLFMFPIREAAIYGGLIEGKVPIWRKYSRLLHKKLLLETGLVQIN